MSPVTDRPAPPRPWWRGTRGEWYVVAQFALLALVALGPATVAGHGRWDAGPAAHMAGAVLLVAGALLLAVSARRLGPALTPLPLPSAQGRLVQSGPYAVVRHPIYTAVLCLAVGCAPWRRSWLVLGYAGALLLLLDVKARREERWLRERYPDYAAYARRVRRLIPWMY